MMKGREKKRDEEAGLLSMSVKQVERWIRLFRSLAFILFFFYCILPRCHARIANRIASTKETREDCWGTFSFNRLPLPPPPPHRARLKVQKSLSKSRIMMIIMVCVCLGTHTRLQKIHSMSWSICIISLHILFFYA